MKSFKRVVVYFVLAAAIVFSVGILNVEASDSLGDFCWTVSVNGVSSGTIKLGLTSLGGTHFISSGRVDFTDGTTHIVVGNVEIVNNNLVGTITHSWDGGSGISHISLDKSTFNGTYEFIYNYKTSSNSVAAQYLSGSLTYTSCQ